MLKYALIIFLSTFSFIGLLRGSTAEKVPHKAIIYGVGKNIARYFLQTKESIEKAGEIFDDYRVVIYENNSTDGSKLLLRKWRSENPRVDLILEDLSQKELDAINGGKRHCRIHQITAARNKVLDHITNQKYDGFDIVIAADLDFSCSWPHEEIYKIVSKDQKRSWDAVLAHGLAGNGYIFDTYAYIDDGNPFTSALLGQWIFDHGWFINGDFNGEWRKVYSAFGGLGIYKREAIEGCRYSPCVTLNLERLMRVWVKEAIFKRNPYYEVYQQELAKLRQIKTVAEWEKIPAEKRPGMRGIRLTRRGLVWISNSMSLSANQTVCEHITFHADMISKGRDRIYVDPELIMQYE